MFLIPRRSAPENNHPGLDRVGNACFFLAAVKNGNKRHIWSSHQKVVLIEYWFFTCSMTTLFQTWRKTWHDDVLSFALLRFTCIYKKQTQQPEWVAAAADKQGGVEVWWVGFWFSDRRTGALEKSISLIIIQGVPALNKQVCDRKLENLAELHRLCAVIVWEWQKHS